MRALKSYGNACESLIEKSAPEKHMLISVAVVGKTDRVVSRTYGVLLCDARSLTSSGG